MKFERSGVGGMVMGIITTILLVLAVAAYFSEPRDASPAYESQSVTSDDGSKDDVSGEAKVAFFVVVGVMAGATCLTLYFVKRNPVPLELRDKDLVVQDWAISEARSIPYKQIHYIEYRVTRLNDTTRRYLVFMDEYGWKIDSLNMDSISNGGINKVQREISARAPHIEWILPE